VKSEFRFRRSNESSGTIQEAIGLPLKLQVDEALNAAAQPVRDEGGASSPLALSLNTVEVGAPNVPGTQQVFGDVHLEKGSGTVDGPKLGLRSRGPGNQHYVLRATNNHDPAGGRAFIIRNEDQNRDDFILDAQGNASIAGDLHLETGSGNENGPKLGLRSRGPGTQHYSLRATNNLDPARGQRLVIRNESEQRDDIVLDPQGNVTFSGDIILRDADCAEEFDVDDPFELTPGSVVCIGREAQLRLSTEAYDRRVAGVVAGAGDLRPGILLGRHATGPSGVPVALLGRVWCKVDASSEAVEVGDILTTADTPGHAMKASDPQRSFGAVIGKALDRLAGGTGLIRVLVALQ
jgi:hypothetical protein